MATTSNQQCLKSRLASKSQHATLPFEFSFLLQEVCVLHLKLSQPLFDSFDLCLSSVARVSCQLQQTVLPHEGS